MDDETKFKEYFRLSPHLFSSVIALLKDDLDGTPTNWIKRPITADQKLCITLRYFILYFIDHCFSKSAVGSAEFSVSISAGFAI